MQIRRPQRGPPRPLAVPGAVPLGDRMGEDKDGLGPSSQGSQGGVGDTQKAQDSGHPPAGKEEFQSCNANRTKSHPLSLSPCHPLFWGSSGA